MRDYPIIQAYVAWMAIIYVVVNLITDIIYHYLDPQVRLGAVSYTHLDVYKRQN